ncbi:DUF4129 domain-containing protein [Arsenicibacter rosenii]|uniref:Protein-glutamine gamma-glutamyltransferase-like C-terminal domain-containing protein n=1 Tax=Arsenicibacter rosenii TaxID=1750698 RepID=A0A1S2VG84_9BACT|nr:DUF4129 domain-containing protein [Arsenicibacter rosenii]OIN57719.1 hypothetical protein BLX24_18410 [Arsenicibacter rosenii]
MLLWLMAAGGPVWAQTPQRPASETVSLPAPDDRAPMTVRYPPADRLSDYRSQRDYQYDYDTRIPENPLARFRAWLTQKIRDFLRSKAYHNFWQYVILLVIAGVAIWLLVKADVLRFMFTAKASELPLDYENITENIHEINFEQAIDEAVQRRNFRLAIRLLYLQTLKQLTDKRLIDWKPDKTNRQYLVELIHTPLHQDFDRLTTRFEYVWYGDFPVDEQSYRQFASDRQAMIDRK